MKFGTIEPATILSYGVIGLGFLLALLAYFLLLQEQHTKEPRESILAAINRFMIFSLVLAGLGLTSEVVRSFFNQKPTPDPGAVVNFDDYLADLRNSYAHASRPESFKRGTLTVLGQGILRFNLPSGTCKRYLAVAQPPSEIDLSWMSSGPGASAVRVELSGSENFKTGTICTDEKPGSEAEMGLVIKILKGSGEYAIETYFLSQRIYDDSLSQ
ncbi:hypothetical protein [Pseudomonas sediminis]|uniref:Uncharacterized protein n=1 Tax=Pseudomonas sediminis TaxID=1691904 RepID=A0A2G5FU52_9PSED|nr:hypothetical protein [Pseudomonas sediminis]PIA71561.1 hypothetical protein CDO35_00795 [Pseudomonas sediminis]